MQNCQHNCWRTYVRVYVRMYVRMYVCMYVCMYICMYYVCMYACTYVCIYTYVRARARVCVCVCVCVCVWKDSVGIATHYGLNVLGFKRRLKRELPHPPGPSPKPNQLHVNDYMFSPLKVKRPECGLDHLPKSSTYTS
jgi:hypothetical protein